LRKEVIEWLLLRVTGVILLAGLALHFYTMHYGGPAQTGNYWKTFNFIFLLSAIYHGFNGLLGIMLEYVRSPITQKILEGVLIISALILVGFGYNILTV
jgi:succinate dehydrogenase / fumarate reductase membrane anchor subunit